MAPNVSPRRSSDQKEYLPDQGDMQTPPDLSQWYDAVRRQSPDLCAVLEIEDYGVQPMADASPPKWHLAHTTWFFETFILKQEVPGYTAFHPQFEYLFNSYYNGVGQPFPRPSRGHLSRPTVKEVLSYRAHVDAHMQQLLAAPLSPELKERVTLGLHHEQQHQELLITDLKYNFGHNPLYPVYTQVAAAEGNPGPMQFLSYDGGIVDIGVASGDGGFAFDNEYPQHQVLLQPFEIADRLVTNGDYMAFIEDGGYREPSLWLSEGWSIVQQRGWQAPLYWQRMDGQWLEYRLDGLHSLVPELPVTHVSAHEAFAFAAWCGARLPTEFEWETVARTVPVDGSFAEAGVFHPGGVRALDASAGPSQLYGDLWQWTCSAYSPYPGYAPLPGTLGEYNGKFMSSQLVLRGGSCATPRSHIRPTYRNFFYPPDRWQFTGIRLARHV